MLEPRIHRAEYPPRPLAPPAARIVVVITIRKGFIRGVWDIDMHSLRERTQQSSDDKHEAYRS
jgi:hypothetical protein